MYSIEYSFDDEFGYVFEDTERNESIAFIMKSLYGDVELNAIQYNELYESVAALVDQYSNI